MVDYSKIQSKIPSGVYPDLVAAMQKYEINTINRASHFVSQCMHESANYTRFVENLNYSAEGLRKVFPKYFPDDATANAYARQPEKIGSRVYADRMGNGSEATKEGFKFRGRGGIQRTGKNNYKLLSDATGIDFISNPDLLLQSKYFTVSDALFFKSNGLNIIADKGATDDVVKEITKRINGGYVGLSERQAKFKEMYSLFK